MNTGSEVSMMPPASCTPSWKCALSKYHCTASLTRHRQREALALLLVLLLAVLLAGVRVVCRPCFAPIVLV